MDLPFFFFFLFNQLEKYYTGDASSPHPQHMLCSLYTTSGNVLDLLPGDKEVTEFAMRDSSLESSASEYVA